MPRRAKHPGHVRPQPKEIGYSSGVHHLFRIVGWIACGLAVGVTAVDFFFTSMPDKTEVALALSPFATALAARKLVWLVVFFVLARAWDGIFKDHSAGSIELLFKRWLFLAITPALGYRAAFAAWT